MRSTFEEKTYENYFNSELDRRSEIFFPPGQVQEGSLGFDSSAFSTNRRLWQRLGHPFWFFHPFRGVQLQDIAEEMEHVLQREIENIPKMKANILFQYKKPEYISQPSGSEWYLWNRSYYRYNIYEEQQDLLMHIYRKFKDSILLIYAAPAIHDVNELVRVHQSRDVINYSNFTKAQELINHHRNTYVCSGTHSIACSEPEQLNSIDLVSELNGLGRNNENKTESNRDFIVAFRKQMISIVNESQYFSESFQSLNNYNENRLGRYELVYSFFVLANLKQLTNIQWLIKI